MATLEELAASEPQDDLAALAASEPQDDLASLAASEPPDEPANFNVGVMPMPLPEPALVGGPKDRLPGAYTLGGPEFAAFQATHSGVSGDQAAQALKLSKRTGFAPEMVAQNLDTLQQRVDQSGFEDGLGAAPVLADYAAKGHVQASLIKEDVGPLAALEQGLSDLSYGLAATAQSYFPTDFVERGLQGMEADTSAYEKKDEGIIAGGLRQVPTLGFYYAAGIAGARLGGKPGELVANTGAMYVLSRGTLYRKLMQQMPIPASDEEGIIGQGAYDPVEYERKARNYATVGAMASATLATGLSHLVGMATPAVVTRVSTLSNNLIARAFTDPATRDVIGNLIGKVVEEGGVKTATGLGGYTGHTLSGTLAMVVSAVAEDATVQEAIKGQIDPSKAAAVAWGSFKHALVAAGILSAIPHVLPAVKVTGRAAMAPFDVARLDHNVEQIQASRLPQRNQPEAERLVGRMAAGGDADTVYVSSEALAEDPKLAEKVADAAGPHAVGDAHVTGGDVAVPAEKYLVRLGGDHAALRENVKTIEDGSTLKEAAEAPRPDTMGALMAARSYALQTEPDTLERTAKLQDIEARMRSVASRGLGMPDTGKGTPEEVAAEMAKLEAELAKAHEPPPPAYEVPKTPKVTVDDEAVAREHIEGKTIGEIRPSYYETQGRRAGDRITKLASGPDTESERIFGKYAEALGVSLDSLRNAVQGTFSADTLPQARKKLRTAETEANRLEAGRMQTLTKLEGEHAMNVARRQGAIFNEVQNQKRAKLFAGVAQDIRDELDRTETRLLKKAGDNDFRGMLAKAGSEYLDAHDAMFAAVFGDGSPAAGVVDTLTARMQRDGTRVKFDEAALRDLLVDPKPWKDLTPAEGRNFSDMADNIRAAAEHAKTVRLADRRATVRDIASELTGLAADLPSYTYLQKQSGVPLSWTESLRLDANAWNGVLLRPKGNISLMGETFKKATFDRLIEARNGRDQFMRDTGEFYRKNVETLPAELRKIGTQEVRVGQYLPTLPGTAPLDVVPRTLLWKLHLETSSEGNMSRVLSGNGWERERVETMLYHDSATKLTRPELDFLQTIHDHNNEKVWPLLKAKEERLDGVAPTKIGSISREITFDDGTTKTYPGGYHPLSRDTRFGIAPAGADAGAFKSVDDFFGPEYQRAQTFKPFTKERAVDPTYVVDLNWSTIAAHMTQVGHDIYFDEPVRDVAKLLIDPEIQRAAVSILGPKKAGQLPAYLRAVATQRGDSTPQNVAIVGKAFGALRSRMITSIVGDSIPLALLQTGHVPFAVTLGEAGGWHALPALFSVFKPFTMGDDGIRMFPTWRDNYAESTELMHRDMRNTRRVLEDMNMLAKPAGAIGRGLEKWRSFSGIFMHAMDRYLSTWIYEASKNQALAREMPRDQAIEYANGKVQDLLPTHDIETASPILTSRQVGSMLIMHGFQNTVYQLRQAGIRDTALDFHYANTPTEYMQAGAKMTWRIARWTAALAALGMSDIAGGHGPDKDKGESWEEWMARRSLAGQGMDIPIAGQLLDPLAGAISSKVFTGEARMRKISIRQAPMLATLQKAADVVGEFANGNIDDEKLFFDAAETALMICKVPSRQTRNTAQYIYDLVKGNTSPRGPFDVAGGIGFGERPNQSLNPGTAIQDLISGG